jgi:peptidoglycan/xylan/chitin deacetylase (PgdA/CDA1 family)
MKNQLALKPQLYNNNFLKISLVLLLLIFSIFTMPIYSFSETSGLNSLSCNCVVFRLDDVQDSFLNNSQIALMNLFISKKLPLSLGLIINYFGNDSSVTNKLREGYKLGLFETALHGWKHENFSKLTEQEQQILLIKANSKLHKLFGIRSPIFFPPYNDFNESTIDAMEKLEMRVISSFDELYIAKNQTSLITYVNDTGHLKKERVFHFPTTEAIDYNYGNKWIMIPVNQTEIDIHKSISKYGYAIIMLHPEGFANSDNGMLTNSVNMTKLNNFKDLIDAIASSGVQIQSFHELAHLTR